MDKCADSARDITPVILYSVFEPAFAGEFRGQYQNYMGVPDDSGCSYIGEVSPKLLRVIGEALYLRNRFAVGKI